MRADVGQVQEPTAILLGNCNRRRTMFRVLLLSIGLSFASARPSTSILQPLPKHYDAGDASIVFVKDRMNILAKGFEHTKDGIMGVYLY